MNNLFFSIIIPTYNRSQFLKSAIDSVLFQNFSNFEIIIIDDGSIDDTKIVVDEYKNVDYRVSYFFQNNSERAISRNNGASKAKGKFLIFLDSDDFFSNPDHLCKLYDFIKNNNFKEGLYFTGAKIKSGDKFTLTRDYPDEELNKIDFFINESIIPARVCLSKSIFNFMKFDDECIVVEDTVLWTLVKEKYSVFYVPIFSVTYLLHDDNSVNIKISNAYLKRLKGLRKLFHYYKIGKKIPYKTKQTQLNRCYLGVAEFYLNKDKLVFSKLWIIASIFRFPNIEIKHKLKMLILP
jgi:glycosyltransferase involved in cell wall biosynthesis